MAPPKRRLDFLGSECDLGGIPIPEFEAMYCGRCAQPECSRSQHGKSRFDQRVQNWQERLFTKVPRMDPKDPRFELVSAKNFKMIDVGPSVVIGGSSAWLDAHTPSTPAPAEDEPAPDTDPMSPPEPAQPSPTDPIPPPLHEASAPLPASPLAAGPPAAPAPRHVLLMNTPNQPGGRMLPGAPNVTTTPPARRDAWAAPTGSDEKIVKPGARIKLGGGV